MQLAAKFLKNPAANCTFKKERRLNVKVRHLQIENSRMFCKKAGEEVLLVSVSERYLKRNHVRRKCAWVIAHRPDIGQCMGCLNYREVDY